LSDENDESFGGGGPGADEPDASELASPQTKADLLRHLLASNAEFLAAFQVSGDDEEIPADVRAAFPGATLTLRFDFNGVRDTAVVARDGAERFEFWAAFYRVLGGERFFSIPVERLMGIADVRLPGQRAHAAPVAANTPAADAPAKPRPFTVIRGGKA
jgi:hypothetical protein